MTSDSEQKAIQLRSVKNELIICIIPRPMIILSCIIKDDALLFLNNNSFNIILKDFSFLKRYLLFFVIIESSWWMQCAYFFIVFTYLLPLSYLPNLSQEIIFLNWTLYFVIYGKQYKNKNTVLHFIIIYIMYVQYIPLLN